MSGRARDTWQKFKQKAFVIRSFEEHESDRAASGHDMHRCLGPVDLVMLGIGEREGNACRRMHLLLHGQPREASVAGRYVQVPRPSFFCHDQHA